MVQDIPTDSWVHGQDLSGGQVFEPKQDYTSDRKPFSLTYLEYLYKNASKRVTRISAGISNGTVALYTVPQGHTLFLTGGSVVSYGVGIAYLLIGVGATIEVLCKQYCNNANSHESTTLSYSLPVRVPENEIIAVESSQVGLTASATIAGFLVPNSFLKKES